MKVGKIYPASWEIHCPECRLPIAAPSGSYLWTEEDMDRVRGPLECESGHQVRKPKVPGRA